MRKVRVFEVSIVEDLQEEINEELKELQENDNEIISIQVAEENRYTIRVMILYWTPEAGEVFWR